MERKVIRDRNVGKIAKKKLHEENMGTKPEKRKKKEKVGRNLTDKYCRNTNMDKKKNSK